MVYVGTAGWSIPPNLRGEFQPVTSHLQAYSKKFNCVEVNSSFYRNHKWQTYAKWAEVVPDHFQFSVKLAKEITHVHKLEVSNTLLRETLEAPLCLKEKLGALLIQLAPSHALELSVAHEFFSRLRSLYLGRIALEPRHSSWSKAAGVSLLHDYGITLVVADPKVLELPSDEQSDVGGFGYTRLHGSPLIYKSRYDLDRLNHLAQNFHSHASRDQWCIFDNTTFGYATQNAIELNHFL